MSLPSFDHALDLVFQWTCQATLSATVLLALVLLVRLLFRRALPPRWHYALGLLVLLRLALPFAPASSVSVFNLANRYAAPAPAIATPISRETLPSSSPAPILDIPISAPATDSRIAVSPAAAAFHEESSSPAHAHALNLIFLRSTAKYLWLAGWLAMLAIIVRRHRKFTAQLRKWEQVREPRVLELLKECRATLRVRRNITILAADSLNTPALFGVFQPRLLVPAEMLGRLDDRELHHIFLHEMVHLRHGDVLINYAALLLRSLHWFNPFVWLALRRLRADQELACDAAVISRLAASEQLHYGSTLIKLLADFPAPDSRYCPGVVPFITHKQAIKRRIQMIANFRSPGPMALAASLALTVALACVTFTRAADNPSFAALPASTAIVSPVPQPANETDSSAQPSASAVTVDVAADGRTATLRGYPQRFDREQLQDALRAEVEKDPHVRLNVQGAPGGNMKYQDLAWIFDLANQLKITNVTLSTAMANTSIRSTTVAMEPSQMGDARETAWSRELRDLDAKIAAQEMALKQNAGYPAPDSREPSSSTGELPLQADPTALETQKDLLQKKTLLNQLQQLSSADLRQVLPTTIPDALLTQSLQDLNAAQAKYAALRANIGPNNPEAAGAAALAAKLNSQVDERVKGILRGLQTQIDTDQEVIATLKRQSADDAQRSQYDQYIQAKAELDQLKVARENVLAKLKTYQQTKAQAAAQKEPSPAAASTADLAAVKEEIAKLDEQIRQTETNLIGIRYNAYPTEPASVPLGVQQEWSAQILELKGQAAEQETTLKNLKSLTPEALPQAVATVAPDETLQRLLSDLATAKSELSKPSVTLPDNHPDARTAARNLIPILNEQIAERAKGNLAALQFKLGNTQAHIKQLEDSLEFSRAQDDKIAERMAPYYRGQVQLEQLKALRKVLQLQLEQEATNQGASAIIRSR